MWDDPTRPCPTSYSQTVGMKVVSRVGSTHSLPIYPRGKYNPSLYQTVPLSLASSIPAFPPENMIGDATVKGIPFGGICITIAKDGCKIWNHSISILLIKIHLDFKEYRTER